MASGVVILTCAKSGTTVTSIFDKSVSSSGESGHSRSCIAAGVYSMGKAVSCKVSAKNIVSRHASTFFTTSEGMSAVSFSAMTLYMSFIGTDKYSVSSFRYALCISTTSFAFSCSEFIV